MVPMNTGPYEHWYSQLQTLISNSKDCREKRFIKLLSKRRDVKVKNSVRLGLTR